MRRRASLLALVTAVLSTALDGCGSDDPAPMGPPTPAMFDLSPVAAFLNDPLILLLPSLLENGTASAPLRTGLLELSMAAREDDLAGFRSLLASTRTEVAHYRSAAKAKDGPALNAVALALLQAELILDLVVGEERVS